MTVKLIRMWSGEDVIADIVEESTDSIVITDPIVAVPSPQQGNIGFAPWSPLLEKDKIEVTKKYLSNKLLKSIISFNTVKFKLTSSDKG